MSAACPRCNGSGELLRGTGIYDCAAPDCTAAVDRTALEDSLPAAALGHPLDTLWIGYQAGVVAALKQARKLEQVVLPEVPRIPKPKMVERKCKWCKGVFMARSADVKRGWGLFCSKSCKASRQEIRTGQYRAIREEESGEFSNAHLFSNEDHDCNKD